MAKLFKHLKWHFKLIESSIRARVEWNEWAGWLDWFVRLQPSSIESINEKWYEKKRDSVLNVMKSVRFLFLFDYDKFNSFACPIFFCSFHFRIDFFFCFIFVL